MRRWLEHTKSTASNVMTLFLSTNLRYPSHRSCWDNIILHSFRRKFLEKAAYLCVRKLLKKHRKVTLDFLKFSAVKLIFEMILKQTTQTSNLCSQVHRQFRTTHHKLSGFLEKSSCRFWKVNFTLPSALPAIDIRTSKTAFSSEIANWSHANANRKCFSPCFTTVTQPVQSSSLAAG